MKHARKMTICALLVVLLLLLAGCDAAQKMMDELDDAQIRQMTQTMVDSVLAQDEEAAWPVMEDAVERDAFKNGFEMLCQMLVDVESYELQVNHVSKNVTNGVSSITIRYLMTAGDVQYWVTSTVTQGYDGLTNFNITPVTTQTGTIGKMDGANAAQWIILVLGFAEFGFVLWMLIDCCRRKLKKKWIWILVVLLGGITLLLTVTPQQFRFRFNYGLVFQYTSLIRYSTGGFQFRLYLPAGAVAYAFCKKHFTLPPEQPEEPSAEA